MNISKSIIQFIDGKGKNKGRKPDERYASFDYCYNYFHSFYKNNTLGELTNEKNMPVSCLQLGFYLASWGMMRGSSFLLEKSVRTLRPVIETIAHSNTKLWEIDIDDYTDENIGLLLDCKRQIIDALGRKNKPSDTLITKIMLGVYANVPAFDQYFRKSLKVHTFNKKALLKIRGFCREYKEEFDSIKICTLDFSTGKETDVHYTKAKLIDMYGFMKGQ
jgi:hypothetical protein